MTTSTGILTFDSIGDTLPNGATILAISARRAHEWVILARVDHADEIAEYVTWRSVRPGDGSDTRWGHYFEDLDEAQADFRER